MTQPLQECTRCCRRFYTSRPQVQHWRWDPVFCTTCIREEDPSTIVGQRRLLWELARMSAMEHRVYRELMEDEGTDIWDLQTRLSLSASQVSSALSRLKRKGLAHGQRWHGTSVWYRIKYVMDPPRPRASGSRI